MKNAAVGLLIKDEEILLIRRKSRTGDPWSGQIGLPGGFFKNEETGKNAVLREIYEETNLQLEEQNIVGELETEHTAAKPGLNVHPFVLSVSSYENAKPGPEIAEIKIAKLSKLKENKDLTLNCLSFVVEGWIIWGLTYRIIKNFLNQY